MTILNQSTPNTRMPFRQAVENSLREALRCNTPDSLRAFSFDCDERAKSIGLKAHLVRPYTDDEYDHLMTVEGEMWAQFPDDYGYRITFEFEIAPVGDQIHPLGGGVIYLRAGEPTP